MYYACEEHIELALDIVVDETEHPPIVDKIEQSQKLSTTCSFCKNEPVYTIK
ncbi:CxxH/CxxC protein [Halalkalibacter sp. APA_J-10(15)]|uniref:CxxH/CxxC protein n=1 Tax=Halalkalibacter sp. APA_J-10(15) TaxID=2933805 RepID=UPI001FF3475F|nr:CxxH/CxxC protein [Halalkalibacter sp. APA_J-10(15)]MCK0469817.1 CxxH/CxxC protein [Halalkalibacter sp. APA_J-10(15)]